MLFFDIADAPNFAARLAEAGIEPARFRLMPRLSVVSLWSHRAAGQASASAAAMRGGSEGDARADLYLARAEHAVGLAEAGIVLTTRRPLITVERRDVLRVEDVECLGD
jgi:hypothetical protein